MMTWKEYKIKYRDLRDTVKRMKADGSLTQMAISKAVNYMKHYGFGEQEAETEVRSWIDNRPSRYYRDLILIGQAP